MIRNLFLKLKNFGIFDLLAQQMKISVMHQIEAIYLENIFNVIYTIVLLKMSIQKQSPSNFKVGAVGYLFT